MESNECPICGESYNITFFYSLDDGMEICEYCYGDGEYMKSYIEDRPGDTK